MKAEKGLGGSHGGPSVRVEDVGDFGRAINMKVSWLAPLPLLLSLLLLLLLLCHAADSLSNILIQEIEMKLLGVKLIENILHFQRPLPAKVCADPSILSFPFRSFCLIIQLRFRKIFVCCLTRFDFDSVSPKC